MLNLAKIVEIPSKRKHKKIAIFNGFHTLNITFARLPWG
uniref:Uncharacterized protein n=1 Tax=Anguilla anguilla TaxID=7936 RepID=A0A0E9S803_ANGAN